MNQIIILAAGKGTRMATEGPKALVKIKGKPMIKQFLKRIACDFPRPIIVVGHKKEQLRQALGPDYEYIEQTMQGGTGHAVQCVVESFQEGKKLQSVVVVPGDHPLITLETVRELIDFHNQEKATISLATVRVPSFEGDYEIFYNSGRIVRDADSVVQRIVELKEASLEEKNILETHPSYYCFDAEWLWNNIHNIKNDNSMKEYYLTDIIEIAVKQKKKVAAYVLKNPFEGLGVNTQEQLLIAEKHF